MSDRASQGVELDAELAVWCKLIHMLSGDAVVIRRLDNAAFCLRPELEPSADTNVVALPARIEALPRMQDNRALYRFLALQLAGRRAFGTYAFTSRAGLGLQAYLRGGREQSSAFEALFLLAEAVRVQHENVRRYPGSVRDTEQLAAALLAEWRAHTRPTHARALDVLLALALVPRASVAVCAPSWLPRAASEVFLQLLEPLQLSAASVYDSLRVARQLVDWSASPVFAADEGAALDDDSAVSDLYQLASDGVALRPDASADDSGAAAVGVGADAPEAGAQPQAGRASGALGDGGTGDPRAIDTAVTPTDAQPMAAATFVPFAKTRAAASAAAQTYLYDEWDHTLGAYRPRYCRVHELAAQSDSGTFFERTLSGSASLVNDVRRQFERIRPERYRPVRGLEDGEDLDLNALTEARIEARARRSPNTRVYTARARQARDVATLFLLDMSASTEQPYVEPGDPPRRRIIDTLKEALAIMATALDDLGDHYAIYGFSSRGRQQVEVYPVKTFAEPLNAAVKARIGGIEPKSGTRMGPALRHVLRKFAPVHARSKHLILLSDGYPQDQEYGPDRRSHTYGIEDTAVALREVNAARVTPFCITVDRAGNDYLRRMCTPDQYLVIEDIDGLPRELPKIYRRVVSA
ncbi:MAG: hypothetical protein RL701_5853 [Pseudomonadota bacterium]